MVLESILEKVPSDDLSVHAVWMPVLQGDDQESAYRAQDLLPDPRVHHYWDADQDLGLAYGKVVPLPRGRELAWDIYFAFASGISWGSEVPPPSEWVHQLGMDERHLDDGTALREAVEALLAEKQTAGAVR